MKMNSAYFAMLLVAQSWLISSTLRTYDSHNRENDFLPRLEAFIVNDKRALLVCEGRSSGPLVKSLEIKCKNAIKYKLMTTVDEKEPSLTISRLLIGRRQILRDKSILCYCRNLYTGKRSNSTEVPIQQDSKNIGSSRENHAFVPYFLPKGNRKRKVNFYCSVKLIWRYHSQNSSLTPQCFHDGHVLSKHEYTDLKEKVVIHIKNVSAKDAGFYSCELRDNPKPTIYSSILRIVIITANPWSKWFTWFPCSAKCGTGRMVEARKCLDLKRRRCDGPNVRTVSCITPCTALDPGLNILEKGTDTTQRNRYYPKHRDRTTIGTNVHSFTKVVLKSAPGQGPSKSLFIVVCIVLASILCAVSVISTLTLIKLRRRYRKRMFFTKLFKGNKEEIWTTSGDTRCPRDITRAKNMSSPVMTRPETQDSYAHMLYTSLFTASDERVIKPIGSSDTQDSYIQDACILYECDAPSFSTNPKAEVKDDPDNDLQRQGSSKSKASAFSAFSSISDYYCPKPTLPDTINPDLCSWGRFNEKGGRLTIKGTGISLYIPKMAIPKGANQVIYIGMMSSKGLYPEVEDGQTCLSPVVICGPDGMQFERPVYLTVPHNAVMDDANSWKPQVFSCSTVPQDENDCDQWKVIEDPEDNEAPLGHVDSKSMQIMIDHFTGYVVVGRPAEVESWIVPFYTEPKVDIDCSVRIYCIPATDAALEELHVKEKKLNGSAADACKLLIIEDNNKDVVVNVKKVRDGWSADEVEQNIPFRDVWQHHGRHPNVSFTFERKSRDQYSFSSSFNVKQDTVNGNTVTVKVSTSIKRLLSLESSGYSSGLIESGCETDVTYKIPLTVRKEMCYLLDPERTDYQDWRGLAEKLKIRKRIIDWLSHRTSESPTNYIIDWWENTKSDEIPLSQLVKMFEDMQRHDVVDELNNIEGVRI